MTLFYTWQQKQTVTAVTNWKFYCNRFEIISTEKQKIKEREKWKKGRERGGKGKLLNKQKTIIIFQNKYYNNRGKTEEEKFVKIMQTKEANKIRQAAGIQIFVSKWFSCPINTALDL